jgi:hypothetical protein
MRFCGDCKNYELCHLRITLRKLLETKEFSFAIENIKATNRTPLMNLMSAFASECFYYREN